MNLNTLAPTDYYTAMMPKMMQNFEKMFSCTKKPASRYLDTRQFQAFHRQARTEYAELIPQIPYIGGKKAGGTRNLVGGVQMLAIIRGLEHQGLSPKQTGEIIYGTWEVFFGRIPRFVGVLIGKMMMTRTFLKNQKRQLLETQKRAHSEAFVSEFVPCTDGSFDYGQDTLECAICKFYAKHGAAQYLPYICLGDYPMFRRLGIGFFRTKTLGHGDDVCDFRFKKAGRTAAGWPPEGLPEWKSKI